MLVETQALIDAADRIGVIGAGLDSATRSAAVPTTNVPAMAADEVSAAVAALVSAQAQEYQQISAQAAAFHGQFVGLMNAGAARYGAAEAANATPLDALNAAALPWFGRPIIGDGANGTTNAQGVGTAGGAGGLLWGNGGRGGDSTATGATGGAGGAGGWLYGNGGRGGNGGPGFLQIDATGITATSGGHGGAGGSALFFGTGGAGGSGGIAPPFSIPLPGGGTFSGALDGGGGMGGSAGLFTGDGGDGGVGLINGHGGRGGSLSGTAGTN